MKTKIFLFVAFLLIVLFTLSACKPEAAPTPDSENATVSEAATAPATEAPAESSNVGSCPVGSWDLSDFSAYMNSIEQNMSASSDNEFTMTSGDFTGASHFVFNEDNTVVFSAEEFTQSFTITTSAAGQTIDIPITLKINGSSTADYSIEADQITFSNQKSDDMVITVDTMGSASTVDQGLLGEPGSIKLYQFACPDVNTLSLKVIAVDNMDLAPLTLTRSK